MTKKEMLGDLFTNMEADEGARIVFNDKYMRAEEGTPERELYETVSDIMRESGLTHGFSYEVAYKACMVLEELEDWSNDEELHELVDGTVPVYNSELMEIYKADWWAVDEAREETGHGDSTSDASMAWFRLIENMARKIAEALND